MNTLNDMLGYGILVAHDDALGLYVTANGAYLNLWVARVRSGVTLYENVDVRSFSDATEGLLALPAIEIIKRAEEFIQDVIREGQAES